MTKRIKSLEKESYEWRSKYEKSTKAMLEMASDKTAQDQYVGKASRQLSQLQKLCRTLQVRFGTIFLIFNPSDCNVSTQVERTSLLDVLKANNIERPPMPELPPEPVIEPPPKSADKLEIMSRNCSELKATLAALQGQMNALTAEKVAQDAAPEAAETAPPKKSKNKKNKNKSCPAKERSPVNDNANPNGNENVEPLEQKTEVEPAVDESSTQNDEIVKDPIDDLVKGIETNCSLESQNGNEVPKQDEPSSPELVKSEAVDTKGTDSKAEASLPLPVNVSSD